MREWGMRNFRIDDPEGSLIYFYESIGCEA